MLMYPAWWLRWLLAKWYALIQLTKRPFCTHREWVHCEGDVAGTLLMDQEFELVCNRCGKVWNKTAWDIINVPIEEW